MNIVNIRGFAALAICLVSACSAEGVFVTFRHSDPAARKVTLAGEFNEWDKDELAMAKNDTGDWEARLDLEPGIYEYKYVVDGSWDKANKDSRMVRVKKETRPEETKIRVDETSQIRESRPPPTPTPPPVVQRIPKPAASAPMAPAGAKSIPVFDPTPLMAGERPFTFSSRGKSGPSASGANRFPFPQAAAFPAAVPEPQPPAPQDILASEPAEPEEPPVKNQADAESAEEEVTFRYKDPGATSVSLVGDFNGWKAGVSPMEKGRNGVWELTLPLAPGEYGYKIAVNGSTDWKQDPEQPLKKDDGFGGQNSMVRVVAGQSDMQIGDRAGTRSGGQADRAQEALESGVKILSNGMVRFVYVDPDAEQVYLGGSFNGWLPDAWPMMKMSNGVWVATIKLKAGIYTYKYNIGGVWKLDPGNPMTKEGGYGPDSLLEINPPAPAIRKVSVPFTVRADKAKRVTLAGEFNGWDPNGIELRKKSDGWWSTTIDLKPGTYEYKFLADGDWESLSRKPQKIEVK